MGGSAHQVSAPGLPQRTQLGGGPYTSAACIAGSHSTLLRSDRSNQSDQSDQSERSVRAISQSDQSERSVRAIRASDQSERSVRAIRASDQSERSERSAGGVGTRDSDSCVCSARTVATVAVSLHLAVAVLCCAVLCYARARRACVWWRGG
jgi:hypothetical protein